MIDFLTSFKSLIKINQIHTDNNVFKLHYKATVILLLAFSILLTSKQYFGDPIKCDVDDKERKELLDIFCWVLGTFIVPKTLTNTYLPGLGNVEDASSIVRQGYYQWVCIVFCVQALIFYLPRYLWKTWEGGRLRLLVEDLKGPAVTPNWNSATKDKLIKYLTNGRYAHNVYTVRYCFCEILNFLNVIAQIYFMNWFIGYKFSVYGISYAMFTLVNPMNSVFPKMTKCHYYKYGPSGTVEMRDSLCILPLNVLNEKFFLVLWYWLFFLLIISFLSLLYRALFLFVPKFRVYLLRAQTRNMDQKRAKLIIDHITYGDFFLLYKVGKNIDQILFKDLVVGMHDFIVNKEPVYKNYPPLTNEV